MTVQVVVGTVSFDIIGKTWVPRGRRGREVEYLILFTNCAAGEEDWVPARKIMYAVTACRNPAPCTAFKLTNDGRTTLLVGLCRSRR